MAIVEDYFYDTEFWERGPHQPIDFISIGIRRRTAAWSYYAVCNEFDFMAVWNDPGPNGDFWMRENVLRQLPLTMDDNQVIGLNHSHPSVKSRIEIRHELEMFFELNRKMTRRLWAWYADYDHVVLSQIFGTMSQLPSGMPMFTHDLKQVVDLAGNPPMPKQEGGEHHALDDATHLMGMFEYCLQMGILQPPGPQNRHMRARPIGDNPQA
jgi:hypothetical protein